MSVIRLTEQISGYAKMLEERLRAIDGLTYTQVAQLKRGFSNIRNNLQGSLRSLAAAGGVGSAQAAQLFQEIDAMLLVEAGRMRAQGIAAMNSAYGAGWADMNTTIAFGEHVAAGVGPAGAAYYAPETLAPWGGFAVEAPAAAQHSAALAALTTERIVMVTDEMRRRIRSEVILTYGGQQTAYQAMQNITHIHGIRSHWQFRELGTTGVSYKGENIWRTEMMTMYNAGKNDALEEASTQFPDLKKIWLSTGDDRTRDSHINAHGQVQNWDEPFWVGGLEADFPLDPRLELRERARCRCTHAPYREGWGTVDELIGPLNKQIDAEKARRATMGKTKAKAKAAKPTTGGRAPGDRSGYSTTGLNTAPYYQQQALFERHPKLYGNGNPIAGPIDRSASGLPARWHDTEVAAFKDDVVAELSTRTGVDYHSTNMFIKQWAYTSNGGDMRSMSIQRAAANLSNEIKLTKWQKQTIAKLEAQLESAIAAGEVPSANLMSLFELPDSATGWRPVIQPNLADLGFATGQEVEEALLRAMYEFTQEQLAFHGIDEVVLMRGASLPTGVLEGKQVGDTVRTWNNAIGSWSTDKTEAQAFVSRKAGTEGRRGVMMEVRVPSDRIIGSFRTGLGCANEWEWIVLGGWEDDVTILMMR